MLAKVLSFLGTDAVMTFALCLMGSLSVAIVMRFFVKPILSKVDEYIASKDQSEKSVAVYNAVKSAIYTLVAFTLTAGVLGMLMKVCTFPYDNTPWLAFLYFIPMVALQFFFDKSMKKIACKMFGLPFPQDEEEEEKPKKQKILYKKVAYTIDADGNEVAID
jgi:hypothetical protein